MELTTAAVDSAAAELVAAESAAALLAMEPVASIERFCYECGKSTMWHTYCEGQFPAIAKWRGRRTEYAIMVELEFLRDDFHRIAWCASEACGYVVYFPYSNSDCDRCENADMLYVKEHGFRCYCGSISQHTEEFGPDLQYWLVRNMLGSFLNGGFNPDEWVNFPSSLDFLMGRESRRISTLCLMRKGLPADLAGHIVRFVWVPTVDMRDAIAEQCEAGLIV
jgi:hypothetical protein